VIEGPGNLRSKLYDMTDPKSDQMMDGDQLLDLNEINDAFKKMHDLESKWIAPIAKSTREILSSIDYEEPGLDFSEDMMEHATSLRNKLHNELLFKNFQSDDFVFKDVMPLNFLSIKQSKFLNNQHRKKEEDKQENKEKKKTTKILQSRDN